MSTGDFNLADAVADIAAKEKRAVRRSWIYSGIALLVAIVWLAFAVYKTNQLGNQAASLANEIQEKNRQLEGIRKELDEKRKELDQVSKTVGLSSDELIALYNFGYQNNFLGKAQIEQSIKANTAREQLIERESTDGREGVRIEYFLKDVDREKVEAALRELGFEVTIKTPINSLPTTSIWFGNKVNPQDAKLVAYTLMRAGVQIKEFRPFKPGSPRVDTSLIQVGSNPNVVNEPALSVDEIREMQIPSN